ncbi:MAG TPA: outer membrane protein transport protein [Sulfurovum sp.]|nr:outer membrane protein transport protein [Sulfurovum sp.]HQT29541.1 outer membrane protein transport protein [Sulfurovum sp.]
MSIVLKPSLIAIVGLTPLLATNGDNLIALGIAQQAMGGTGIAHFTAGASATGNPALITQSVGGEFTFGGTFLSPEVDVQTQNTGGLNDLSASSSAKHNVIPYVALTHNLKNGFSVGGSIFGIAGMGTNWTQGDGAIGDSSIGDVGLYSAKTNLTLLKMSAPIAYRKDAWSVGLAPVLLFGTLNLALNVPDRNANFDPLSTSHPVDNGISQDVGYGYELGTTYQFKDAGITLGVVYHSAITMKYDNQLSAISREFGYGSAGTNFNIYSDTLEQPAEIGFGIDWIYGDVSLSADFKNIQWSDATGYKDFNWQNQNVFALGGEYRIEALSLRAGYNYAKNPIQISNDATPINANLPIAYQSTNGDTINTFNHVMFPAISDHHYTFGAGYQFTHSLSSDFAVVYATSPDVTASAKTVGLGDVTVSNNQLTVSVGLNIHF